MAAPAAAPVALPAMSELLKQFSTLLEVEKVNADVLSMFSSTVGGNDKAMQGAVADKLSKDKKNEKAAIGFAFNPASAAKTPWAQKAAKADSDALGLSALNKKPSFSIGGLSV